jgi:hypothetical protein
MIVRTYSPVDWVPPLGTYRATYAEKYQYTKNKWDLRITAEQQAAIDAL